MSSALNLIIARGFANPIQGAIDGYNQQKGVRQQREANDVAIAGQRQSQQINAQEMQAKQQAEQAERQRMREVEQLLAILPEVDSRLQQNPNDPEARAIAIEINARLNPKEATSGLQGLLYPSDQGSGFGNVNPGDYTPDSLARYAQTKNYADLVRAYAPPGQVLVNTPGFGVGIVDKGNPNNRTMLTSPQEEAQARADAAAATTGAKEGAKAAASAIADLPRIQSNAQDTLSVLEQLKNSDGFNMIYGPASLAPIVPGTRQADAYALWEQLNGKAFLQAFETLKGGGQITETEGEKATAAITRLANRKTSPKAARAALQEFETIIRRGLARAEERAGRAQSTTTQSPSDTIDFSELPD